MKKPSISDAEIVQFRRSIKEQMRQRVRDAIQVVLEEELDEALGSKRYERTDGRRGYRNGSESRRVTTANGVQELRVPRGRLLKDDGSSEEFQSSVLPRYKRRSQEVDDAILSSYLAGANSRRIRKALGPLLGESNLSKSSVSRVVARLKGLFANWNERRLDEECYAILFLDGFHLKVRMARRLVSVPVLAALGVAQDGSKRLVSLRLATRESGASWSGLIEDLDKRGLRQPLLLVTDGHAGLKKAKDVWRGIAVQRCTFHKWRNIVEHCPRHARREAKRDYDAIIYAQSGLLAREAYDRFVSKWSTLCPAVARSLEEAGLQLLTFFNYPKGLWRGIRTTNSLENLNREFRRRTKTQGSFSTEEAALTLLFGLVAFRQIELRRISGYKRLAALNSKLEAKAA